MHIIDVEMNNSHWQLLWIIIFICVICRSLLVDVFLLVFLFFQSVKNLGPRCVMLNVWCIKKVVKKVVFCESLTFPLCHSSHKGTLEQVWPPPLPSSKKWCSCGLQKVVSVYASQKNCWCETPEENVTDLLERKGDTPLLLRPGVKIEDNRFLLLFTPVLCASTQYLMYVSSFFKKYSHLSTLCTEMFFSTKESGSTASQPFDSTMLLERWDRSPLAHFDPWDSYLSPSQSPWPPSWSPPLPRCTGMEKSFNQNFGQI